MNKMRTSVNRTYKKKETYSESEKYNNNKKNAREVLQYT